MLKNIISIIFLTTFMITSAASIAADAQVTDSTSITTVTVSDETIRPDAENTQILVTAAESQEEETSNITFSATAWVFTFALLGFVLLSNRRGV